MIALVDCNNFFVSCERVFEPRLRGKPIGVLSNNDGCIISRSNELKAMGVKMCDPAFQIRARSDASKIILRSSNFPLYSDLSRRIMTILSMHTPELEPYSIDEAFMRLPDGKTAELYAQFARGIRHKIARWTSVPVSVGVASTKTLAKLASHLAKTSSKGTFIMPENPMDVIREIAIDEVWGIGRRTSARLNRQGIETIEQLLALDEAYILQHFNAPLRDTIEELRGIAHLEIEPEDEAAQSVSVSRSFGTPVTTLKGIEESAAYYTAILAQKLRRENIRARGCTLYAQYYPEYKPVNLPAGTTSTQVLFTTAKNETADILHDIRPHLAQLFIPGRRYKKTGVIAFGLVADELQQDDLFAPPPSPKNEKLYQVMDALNQKMGKGTVFHLAEGVERDWQMRSEFVSPAYTTEWDALPTVLAR